MKKIALISLAVAALLLSPLLYVAGTFALNGPIPDEQFQQALPSIVENLEVKIEGNGDKTLVMIHGYPDSLEMWEPQVEFLKEHYTVARFTLPGFEQKDTGERPHYSIQQIRMISDAFIASLNAEHVTVIAHDWGAMYASHYLAQNDLVDQLILLDIGSYGSEPTPAINAKYTFALGIAWTLPETLGHKLTLYTAEHILELEKNVDPNKSVHDLRTDPRMTYPYWHLWNAIFTKTLPTAVAVEDFGTELLFIYGEDKQIWFHGEQWQQQVIDLNKGQIEAVPGGHWFTESSPALINTMIHDWISAN
ncbi:alpha/beta hydrolase [Ferrimonas pelagia]|uniref:Alpha/beta fold hydrolase n=1 Tax=Ferrimonas pelagia TaxID=1177826 RepID=A0ABP9FEI5_9GAMM